MATEMGLQVPAFRTPPRVAGVDRTIRRALDGSVLVSVRSRGRAWPAVLADMIEGVVVANGLGRPEAAQARNELWRATERIGAPTAVAAETPELPLPTTQTAARAA